MATLHDLFRELGKPTKAEANAPVLLSDRGAVAQVSSGSVEIFAVEMADGKPTGARNHLATVGSGDILFEMGVSDDRLATLAVGSPGTELLRVPATAFRNAVPKAEPPLKRELTTTVDRWVESLAPALATDAPPKKYTLLYPEKETALPPQAVGRVSTGVLWVTQDSGGSYLAGNSAFPFSPGQAPFPVSSRTWLTSFEQGTVRAESTLAALNHGSLWAGLDQLHSMVIVALNEQAARSAQIERERLERRSEADRAAMDRALTHLASAMDSAPGPTSPRRPGGNAMVSACRLVAGELGIEIVNPNAARGDNGSDALFAIARASRFRVRRIALRDDWWRRDNGPLLAFLEDGGTPVAILPAAGSRYVLVDPENGARTPVSEGLADTLASFGFMFYRPFADQAMTALELLKFGFRAAPKRDGVTVLTMGAVTGLLALFTPIATGIIFDDIIPSAERQQLIQLVLALAVMAVAGGLFRLTRGLAMLRLESKMGAAVQAGVWDRLLKLPAPFFRDYLAGDLARRSLGIDSIRRLLTGATLSSLLSGVFSIFSFALLFYYSAKLALVATVLVLVAVVATAVASVLELRYERSLQEVAGRIEGLVLQFITGISKLRVAGAEARAFAVWAEEFTKQKRLAFKSRSVENALGVFNTVFPVASAMIIFAVLAFGTARALESGGQPLSTGSFLAFYAAFGQFVAAALEVNSVLVSLLLIIPIYERAKPILEGLPEVTTEKADPGELTGEIEVNHVSFRYQDDGPTVLDDVNLRVRQGEFVAVVGPSGAGKSSLLRLLLGFETPESGSVYYDGLDISAVDVQSLRRQIGVVLQNAQVLPGSVFENIVGSSPLTHDDAMEAARMAGLDQDIEQMPMGMHTFIPEGGSTLSGGQRQRLLIARAVVGRPRVLLFDEATSALDNRTQAHVSESLERLRTTRIVIAHRLSTIINADRIYVMDAGKVVQAGAYQELIQQEGPFADLASRQIA